MTGSESGIREWVEYLVETYRARLEDAAALDVEGAPVVSLDQVLDSGQS